MEDKIHKSAEGNVMVTGKTGWGKTCQQSRVLPVLPPRSDVTQLRQSIIDDNNTLADTLHKNCSVWIILKSGDECHGE